MRNSIEKLSAETGQEPPVLETARRFRDIALATIALVGVSLALSGEAEAIDKNTIKLPAFDGDARRIPRHKEFSDAAQARNTIMQRYDDDQYSLAPKPGMSLEDANLYKYCVYGKGRYIASYDQGAINTGRIGEDAVGIKIFGMDDCTRFREANVVVGVEARENKKAEFSPTNTTPGIIKWFASSPEYGTLYAGAFNMDEEYSCKKNPDLQVRFTVENVTRSNFLPVAIRVRPEKTLQTITC